MIEDIVKVYQTHCPKNKEYIVVYSFSKKFKNDKLYKDFTKIGHPFLAKIVYLKFNHEKYLLINNSFFSNKKIWGWLNELLKNPNGYIIVNNMIRHKTNTIG